ncbi:hypothetical protein B0H67DRAFT_588396 [Lasiosphaeris hirsuta]|uniref:Uncharacterized protein n=1 Tax=Lasiosphaeris hirsuta TaxID=260670 RepID=A0AA40A1V8_9PEZI|nr:hypothetical protein B0H67DRAFT_588396 [Lasiosphaeris hirsuta]
MPCVPVFGAVSPSTRPSRAESRPRPVVSTALGIAVGFVVSHLTCGHGDLRYPLPLPQPL